MLVKLKSVEKHRVVKIEQIFIGILQYVSLCQVLGIRR